MGDTVFGMVLHGRYPAEIPRERRMEDRERRTEEHERRTEERERRTEDRTGAALFAGRQLAPLLCSLE